MKRIGLAVLPYAVFTLAAAVSWQRWIEPYVDSGRELQIPWRLAHGETLYRDVRFYHGPLAPYLAAGLDRIFGRSLPVRTLLAAAIALVGLEALRRLASRFLAPARACLATAGIVIVAYFLRPGGQMFPFSFDTSIAVAAIAWALERTSAPGSRGHDGVVAACLTAALLCRPEMGMATLVFLAWDARPMRRWLAIALAPVAVAGVLYVSLSVGTPFQTLRQEGWLAVIGPPQAFQNVYAAYAGFDQPALRLEELALASILIGLIATLLVAGAWLSRSAGRGGASIELAVLVALAAVAIVAWRPPESLEPNFSLLPPLVRIVPPLVVAVACARAIERLLRREAVLWSDLPDSVLFVAGTFALRLLLAAGYVGPYNAFLLPLPLLIAARILFGAAERVRGQTGASLPRLVFGAMVIFLVFRGASLAQLYRNPGWSRVVTPAGSLFLTEPVATATQQALADLSARVPPGGAIVGFPEGGFFNYVLGRSNPLPQEQFFPGHLTESLESEVIEALEAHPPDAILLCNVLAVGHGSRAFGRDYLPRLDGFLRARFQSAASFGPGTGPGARIGDPQFFIDIRVPAPSSAPAR